MTSEPVVGLDLADKLGISVIDRKTEKLLFSASISLARGDTQKRLLRLRECLIEVFTRFNPVEIAIEDVFLPAKTSPRTPIALGELRGVARLCAAERDIPVFFYPPRKVKMAVTGFGNASKEDVVHWIESEFRVKVKDHNEADAISIAWTHILERRFSMCQTQA
ncbi:MAG TPA: crossover junction endodeoxyribonuclease RuvC [Candidatus Ozemobacteraceae bacterium]|nr:crossover junction endodeoxyribonuclease RuvC [Candidatus Ozemobacteraceae bacterium]